jgi:glycerol kinase
VKECAVASYVLAIDQGTTSSRAILFRADTSIAAIAQAEFAQHFPASGWVEHEPEDLWITTVATCREVLRKASASAAEIAAIGIANQRETTLLWDRATGEPVHRAIVWQDRRTADLCAKLEGEGNGEMVAAKTGLVLDPYFSGTKAAWILDKVPGVRARAERGALAFGTVDTYLLWRLTGGAVHATDATNASRTLLFDIHRGDWTRSSCGFSMCRARCCPKSAIPLASLARRSRRCSAERSTSVVLPATSRRQPSARRASPRAW